MTALIRCHDTTPLPVDGVLRIVRDSEERAEAALLAGELIYVRAPRKSGKTSLGRRLKARLEHGAGGRAPYNCVWFDLLSLGRSAAPEAFERALAQEGRETLQALAVAAGLSEVEPSHDGQREPVGDFWRQAARLAQASNAPVVVFVDEIEEILGTHRAIGEAWLLALRQAHQDAQGRLAVCVLGRLPVNLLVRSAEATPFNTARELVLRDFELAEVLTMVRAAIETRFEDMDLSPLVARAAFNATGGQPNLTQCLLGALQEATEERPAAVADYPDLIREFLDSEECRPTTTNTYMGIDDAFTEPGVWPAEEALETYALMLEGAARAGQDARPVVTYDPWNDAHRMLEAIGLAKAESLPGADGRFLVVRNRIALRIFDKDWVNRRRMALPPGAEPGAPAGESPALLAMERLARDVICAADWARTHRARITPGSGREIVEGALFEFELLREDPEERLTLQMFKGVGLFGRKLWRHQVKILRQVVDRAPALPIIYRGGELADHGVAYVITQRPAMSLIEPGVYDFIRGRPNWALDQFQALADGLDRLAEEGIVHRTIWPGSIRMEPPEVGSAAAQLQFAGFEFSIMLRSVVGSGGDPTQVVGERRAALRHAFLRQPEQARAYAPPEYLDGLFRNGDHPAPAMVTSGVYSLGLVVAAWFLGPPDPEAFAGVLLDVDNSTVHSPERHRAYLQTVETAILRAEASHHIPGVLGRLLREMIAWEPRDRPTPSQVVETLQVNKPALRVWSTGERKPFLVCYSYRQTAERLAAAGLITSAVGSEDSRRDVEAFLQRELRDASLFYAPRGIAPYVVSPEPEQLAAQWVLKGTTWLFYCQRFERRGRGLGAGVQTPHILRIAYPWPLSQMWRGLPSQTVPLGDYGSLVIAEQQGSPELDPANDHRYQAFDPILALAARNVPAPSFEIAKAAFSWVVEAQKEALELQRFSIRAVGPRDGRAQAYELDEQDYRHWTSATPMRSQVFQASNVTDPRDFFEQVMQEAWGQGDRQVRLRERRTGQNRNNRWSNADLAEVTASGVRLTGVSLPSRAQIELRSASIGRIPLEQQSLAIEELAASPALFDQLLHPHVVVDDEALDDPRIDEAVSRLAGRAGEIVRRIVSCSPLVALQGPPGTGKTTVTAAVIESLLLRDRTERILITSQSHAAVDNIALRIGEMDFVERDHVVCVRVAAEEQFEADSGIDERLRSWRPEAIADRIAERIRRSCAQRLSSVLEDGERKAYEQLSRAADVGHLELTDRVREGANLIFATTAGSRRVARDGYLPRGRFDLTVVDEASKAWPTEIIQPMLIADRQLLVGDYRQLPAFGSTSMDKLLQQCIASNREEFRIFANHRRAVQAWLKLFESFFGDLGKAKFVAADEHHKLPGWRDRLDVAEQLDLQFRMRSDIAEVVSRAFYKGQLKTDPRVDARIRPPWLQAFAEDLSARRGILWVDTRPDRLFRSNNPVVNHDQAKLAAKLLVRARDIAGGLDPSRAVVLSPYRQQNEAIRRALAMSDGSDLIDNVHTVDSFQGREAELVILSLVRGPVGDRNAGSATDRYGFMVQPERVNVMFSRARELLIVLGDFDFYAQASAVETRNNPSFGFDLSFWDRLCRTVGERGLTVDYEHLPAILQVG